MAASCRDADLIPKVAGAGEIFEREGQRLQIMHEGTVVKADGYFGPWMTEIIRRLQGHHEPQEELLFHHLLAHCRPGSRMMEVGAFWAYYTCWFLRAVPGATAICIEPNSSNEECGRENLRLNSLEAKWIRGFAGRSYTPSASFRQESNQQLVEIPCHNFSSLMQEAGVGPVELLHIDAQGAELPFLESLRDSDLYRQVRFVVVSTHHESISGSPKTQGECLKVIQGLGGRILEKHSADESFSGDGLIVASFDPGDRNFKLPTISRNIGGKSLFDCPAPPGGEVNLVAAKSGSMPVRKRIYASVQCWLRLVGLRKTLW
jgi:FkbM family methyltransferase